jgi:hypothetical protein
MAAPTPRTQYRPHRGAHQCRERNRISAVGKPKYGTVSDIVAINDHQLQVDERDGKGLGDGSSAVVKLTGFAFGPDVDVDGARKAHVVHCERQRLLECRRRQVESEPVLRNRVG